MYYGERMKKKEAEVLDESKKQTFKFLGYCPDCGSIIGDKEIPEGKKNIVICYSCEFRGAITKLSEFRIKKSLVDSREENEEHFASVIKNHEEVHGSMDQEIPEDLMPDLNDQMDLTM